MMQQQLASVGLERAKERMRWFSQFLRMLVILCSRVNAGSHAKNSALYEDGLLMALACESSNSSVSLCEQKNSNPPFASHKLPDGVVLDLCLNLAGSESLTSSRSCKPVDLEVLELKRELIGNGAHRQLKSLLIVRQEKFEECQLVIVERLSAGVFADMFELQGLVARAVYNEAAIYGDHNLERPAFDASESMVVVHVKSKNEAQPFLQAQSLVPLHARYPHLSSESHAVVEIKFPILLFKCSQSGENSSHSPAEVADETSKKMPWLILTTRDSLMLDSTHLQWLVPAGDPQEAEIVAFITAFFSIVGIIILWMVSMCSDERKAT